MASTVTMPFKRGAARRLGLRPPTPRPTYRVYLGTTDVGVVDEQEFRRQLDRALASYMPRVTL